MGRCKAALRFPTPIEKTAAARPRLMREPAKMQGAACTGRGCVLATSKADPIHNLGAHEQKTKDVCQTSTGRVPWRNRLAQEMPDFLIIGTQKGGTSSLFHFIEQHPSARVSIAKEVHYFDLNYRKRPSWYRGYFPFSWDHRITGEASPFYLFHPQVPERVRRECLP